MLYEKDDYLRNLGFVVLESERFYYKTLSKYKTLYVEYIDERECYDVFTVNTYVKQGIVKVLKTCFSFDFMLRYVEKYLIFLDGVKNGQNKKDVTTVSKKS